MERQPLRSVGGGIRQTVGKTIIGELEGGTSVHDASTEGLMAFTANAV